MPQFDLIIYFTIFFTFLMSSLIFYFIFTLVIIPFFWNFYWFRFLKNIKNHLYKNIIYVFCFYKKIYVIYISNLQKCTKNLYNFIYYYFLYEIKKYKY